MLVAFLLYQVYILIRGTVAINIFLGLFLFYMIWLLVRALNMELLSSILGQFIGVGVIALIIVFQLEIRKFLLVMGSKYDLSQKISFAKWLDKEDSGFDENIIVQITDACQNFSESKTGALIVIEKGSSLNSFAETGEILKAKISTGILESIFFKNSPLHDGAVILSKNKILAARCILPVTDNRNIPAALGLRHRAAIGISQNTDAHVITVSEETGNIAYARGGEIKVKISIVELSNLLKANYSSFIQN